MQHDHVVRNLIFDPAPPPKSHPKGCSWGQYVLHLSLLSICAHFRIKIFKIDFEIGNCSYLTFWPFPRAPGGGAKNKRALARLTCVSKPLTKFSWILSRGLGGDNITDRRTDRWTDGQTDGGDNNIPDAFSNYLSHRLHNPCCWQSNFSQKFELPTSRFSRWENRTLPWNQHVSAIFEHNILSVMRLGKTRKTATNDTYFSCRLFINTREAGPSIYTMNNTLMTPNYKK